MSSKTIVSPDRDNTGVTSSSSILRRVAARTFSLAFTVWIVVLVSVISYYLFSSINVTTLPQWNVVNDYTIILAIYAFAIVMLNAAFVLFPKFPTRVEFTTKDGGEKTTAGFWLQILIATIVAATALATSYFTEDTGIIQLYQSYFLEINAVIGFGIIVISLYSVYAAITKIEQKQGPAYQMVFGYFLYNLYSISIIYLGTMAFLMGVFQYIHDFSSLVAAKEQLEAFSSEISTLPIAVQAEYVFGQVQELEKTIRGQLNPMFLALSSIFLINYLVTKTDLGNIFLATGTRGLQILTVVFLLLIFSISVFSYLFLFVDTIQIVQQNVASLSTGTAHAGAETIQRINEIAYALGNKSGIIGYLSLLGSEGGGLAILFGAMQFASSD